MREWNERDKDHFPFTLDIVKSIQEIRFVAPVTFFVGENGSGKSTLMESIACAAETITVGSESVKTDKTLAEIRKLSQYLRLSWKKRARRGFFLRAEDFFGYAKSMRQAQEDVAFAAINLSFRAKTDDRARISIHHRHPFAHSTGVSASRHSSL